MLFQFLEPPRTLFLGQCELHKPKVLPSIPVFEFVLPSTLQNRDDGLANDESGSFSESIYPDYCLAKWVCNRAEM